MEQITQEPDRVTELIKEAEQSLGIKRKHPKPVPPKCVEVRTFTNKTGKEIKYIHVDNGIDKNPLRIGFKKARKFLNHLDAIKILVEQNGY